MMCEKKEAEIKEVVKKICTDLNHDPEELIAILHQTQGHFGYLPNVVQHAVAEELGVPRARVYGVITFYSFFTMEPKGKYPISICMGTACYVKGAEKVLEAFEKELDIKNGGTTKDKKFSINTLRCVGACGLAPVLMIKDKVYGRVKPEQVASIIKEYN